MPRRPWMAERGRVHSRRLRRLPLSRRAPRVDLSHKGRGEISWAPSSGRGMESLAIRRSSSPSPLVGEGLGRGVFAQRANDRLQYIVLALDHFIVPEAQDSESLALQPTRPRQIF